MNLFSITSLSVAICCFSLAIFISRIAKTATHKIWAYFNLAVASWAAGTFFASIAKTPQEAILGWRWAYGVGVFTLPIFYHFVYSFCELNKRNILKLVYLFGAVFCPVSLFVPNLVNKLNYVFNSFYYHRASGLFSILMVYLSIVLFLSFYELVKYVNIAKGIKHIQASYVLWSFFIGWSGGIITFLPAYGVPIYPSWNFMICIYTLFMTYAIFKHQLLGIEIVLRKGLVYSTLAAIMTALFFSVFLLVEKFFQGLMGYQSMLITAFAGFLIALGFNPLRAKIQRFLDRLFFRGTNEEIAEENRKLRQEIERSERLRSVGTLAAGMAHEIKNPLTAIKTFTEFLPDLYNDPKFIKKFNHIVGPEVERINSIVSNILSFSRPREYKEEQVNIQQALDDIVELMSNIFIQRFISVEKNYHLNGQKVTGDTEQLKQVFLNILLNAAEAMSRDGKLTVTTEQNPTDGEITISIADTGCGINKRDLKKIFDPFYTNKKGGTGLGLAVVQDILKRHNVKAKINSVVGKGTEFVLIFAKQDKEVTN